jgi:hypothetical protein
MASKTREKKFVVYHGKRKIVGHGASTATFGPNFIAYGNFFL